MRVIRFALRWIRLTSSSSAVASALELSICAAMLIEESGLRRSCPTIATSRSRSAAASSARSLSFLAVWKSSALCIAVDARRASSSAKTRSCSL